MSDLAMCQDDECPSRLRCRRHKESGTVPDTQRQKYADFQREDDADWCGDVLPRTRAEPRP